MAHNPVRVLSKYTELHGSTFRFLFRRCQGGHCHHRSRGHSTRAEDEFRREKQHRLRVRFCGTDEIRADAPNTIVILTADNGAWLGHRTS